MGEVVEMDITRGLVLKQHNAFTMAAYSISVTAQRCMWLGLCRLQEQTGGASVPLDRDHCVVITAQDYADVFLDGNTKNAYRAIREGSQELLRSLVTVNTPTAGEPRRHVKFQIGSVAEYLENTGAVRFRFHELCLPFISRLPPGFTKIYLEGPAKLRSEYAQRLYALMVMMRGTKDEVKFLQMDVDELRECFQVGRQYQRFESFYRRIIQKAVQEIEEKSNLTVEVKKIKQGREVKALRFEFMESVQMDIFKG